MKLIEEKEKTDNWMSKKKKKFDEMIRKNEKIKMWKKKNWQTKKKYLCWYFWFLLATSTFDLMSNQMNHFKLVFTWSDYFSFFLILTHSWFLFSDFLKHFQWTWILQYHFVIVDLSLSHEFLLSSTSNFIYLLSFTMIWYLIIVWSYWLFRRSITLWLSILKIVIHLWCNFMSI